MRAGRNRIVAEDTCLFPNQQRCCPSLFGIAHLANERRIPSLPALADRCDTDDSRFFVLSTRGHKVKDSKEQQRGKTYATHSHVQTTQAIPHKLHF